MRFPFPVFFRSEVMARVFGSVTSVQASHAHAKILRTSGCWLRAREAKVQSHARVGSALRVVRDSGCGVRDARCEMPKCGCKVRVAGQWKQCSAHASSASDATASSRSELCGELCAEAASLSDTTSTMSASVMSGRRATDICGQARWSCDEAAAAEFSAKLSSCQGPW